ncbi:hypothetical protein EUGRSUZ_D00285 [Eucalyptus grandis]|uniref:Uncharacterized protein n=2 Tax=Eucalyptus grandis TaxID=71139 RepID=A0ACC3L2F4_EUCGR|nr:hypothetical protein EUGRSUZ_D00285 [Eucalyptus grandis]
MAYIFPNQRQINILYQVERIYESQRHKAGVRKSFLGRSFFQKDAATPRKHIANNLKLKHPYRNKGREYDKPKQTAKNWHTNVLAIFTTPTLTFKSST